MIDPDHRPDIGVRGKGRAERAMHRSTGRIQKGGWGKPVCGQHLEIRESAVTKMVTWHVVVGTQCWIGADVGRVGAAARHGTLVWYALGATGRDPVLPQVFGDKWGVASRELTAKPHRDVRGPVAERRGAERQHA